MRGEYLDLVAKAPLPSRELAFDIGTGTGVLAAILARRGVKRVVATDLDPRALATIGLTVKDFVPAYERAMKQDYAGARAALTPQMLKTGICGTPEDCIRQLQTVIDAGFDHISIGGPLGRKPAEAMRLIAERVVPAFR